jgi:homocysteine S-methyltransferase
MALTALPQLESVFLTDAGLETDIIFNRGIDLPFFASITLLQSEEGKRALEGYFRGFLELAARKRCGFILESATWRASGDWAEPLGLSLDELDVLNVGAIQMLQQLRSEFEASIPSIVISGCIGPRGDGYDPGKVMHEDEAESYHAHQSSILANAGADQLTAITMTNVPEAIGIARAAKHLGIPAAISFTVETDGRLPTGESLSDAVNAVDRATNSSPAYFMINCAHPSHFATALEVGSNWASRIRGVRANASRCSHAELDAMTELDRGDCTELAAQHKALRQHFPHINVLGGCCGTDLLHIAAIADACL